MLRLCLKLISIFVTSYLLLVTCYSHARAQEKSFDISYDTTYTLDQNGTSQVSQKISIRNLDTKVYASSYTLTVVGKTPKNIEAFQMADPTDKKPKRLDIPYQVSDRDNEHSIVVNFSNAVVGYGKIRNFTINYQIESTAQKNGEVWDITIPKLGETDQVDNYRLTLNVPRSYGNPAYISPLPKSRSTSPSFESFVFEKDDLIKAGIVSSFGDFQIYNFSVTYHIQNPNSQKGETQVAFPPDTAFQRVYYESIDPKPEKISIDSDGNWIGTYILSPQEKKDIAVKFEVQVFAKPQEYYYYKNAHDYPYYLSGNDIWQTTDLQILNLATQYRTPESIYDFVVKTLNYDYSKVGGISQRMGAYQALLSPDQAICTEYTDTFVSIARAAGIPAREVNGYAYTENQKLQPLSLIADNLHSWPEYWDTQKNIWKSVDPTWEDTTGGVDYFNKFDLSHVVFAIHGQNPKLPYPAGAYKYIESQERDITVEFGSLPQEKQMQSSITIGKTSFWELPFNPITRTFHLVNTGKVALYNVPIAILSEGVVLKTQERNNIEFLAPFGEEDIPVSFTPPFWPSFKPMKLTIIAGDERLEYDIPVSQIYGVQILAFFTILLTGLAFLLSSLHILPRGFSKIRSRR